MNSKTYLIKCITNLHVGNGDVNFSVVDNEVQKDPVTGFPCIYSSSLKGALRDYFEEKNCEAVEAIFGSEASDSGKNSGKNSKKGLLKFIQANILFLPVRGISGKQAYYLATCKQALTDFSKLYQIANGRGITEEFDNLVSEIKNDKYYSVADDKQLVVDAYSANNEKEVDKNLFELLKNVFKVEEKRIVIVPDNRFKDLTLPVLARNKLDNNMVSQNLFYEEVVPHESVFYFEVISTGSLQADDALNSFAELIGDKAMAQFGANASIGYGLCELKKLS